MPIGLPEKKQLSDRFEVIFDVTGTSRYDDQARVLIRRMNILVQKP